ncbi:MAG: hypothetical protein M1821_004847 [Bathelium mastoideum]|nr:MAG: hypothetical protein M1821_004847 [Bathelium mastoideum]
MAIDRRKAILLGSAAAIRLILFAGFPALPDLLTGRVEISTPVTSFKRLQEGLFLYTHNVSPYDGGVFHQAPLLLPLFSLLPDVQRYPFATNVFYTVVDLLCANALMQLSETELATSSRYFTSPRRKLAWDAVSIGASFLFNPFTILTCLARSTSVFTNLFIFLATMKAAQGASSTYIIALSFASYLSLYPVLLFPPLALLCYDRQASSVPKSETPTNPTIFAVTQLTLLAAGIGALLYLSHLLTGFSWEFVPSTYGVQLLLPDLTPNVGLWWYFFIEMFDSFREFFLGVFWLHMASYVGGLSFRIRKQPLFVATTLLGIFAVYQPYPSISDTSLYFAFLALYRHIIPLMRYTFFLIAALLYASFLGPAFYYLWIYAGSGNANFFYAITLVWSLGLSFIVADSLYAVLRDEWEVERPEMKGKEARQI